MRVLFTALVATTVLVLEILDNPAFFQRSAASVRDAWSGVAYEKELRIEGHKALSRAEVERLLPINKSISWWMANIPTIQSRLQENPWIKGASIEACPGGTVSQWGCFVISLTERSPRFLASVDGDEWLIASDGTFLLPINSRLQKGDLRDDQKLAVEVRELSRISGLASRVSSPGLLRAQLELVQSIVKELPMRVNRPVSEVEISSGADVRVQFEGVPFPVTVSGAHDAPTLAEQGERCGILLSRFSERWNEIASVDLAFDRVGVVRLKGKTS